MMDGRMIRGRKSDVSLARRSGLPSAILQRNFLSAKRGFSLMELTITIVVGAILMLGMLPLIRIAANRGVEAQFQMRDVVELQSLVERISAWGVLQTNGISMKSQLGSAPGTQSGIANLGEFYLYSADYIEFDGSQAQTPTSNTNLLEIRVGLDSSGPSLSKIFEDNL